MSVRFASSVHGFWLLRPGQDERADRGGCEDGVREDLGRRVAGRVDELARVCPVLVRVVRDVRGDDELDVRGRQLGCERDPVAEPRLDRYQASWKTAGSHALAAVNHGAVGRPRVDVGVGIRLS